MKYFLKSLTISSSFYCEKHWITMIFLLYLFVGQSSSSTRIDQTYEHMYKHSSEKNSIDVRNVNNVLLEFKLSRDMNSVAELE
ncbi:hypothetical protein B9Z55_024143 [Caenorhabditis nigoni]|uniref:Uncharacterized protein n=1 Tax=Caenorhabditis nigoni TaxID=1611254 RepID=A0A2G5ST46_9PELO|nr:hypothetical protein B9Z55_024143 [Caenorhabditis nigoni]